MDHLSGSALHQSTSFTPSQVHSDSQKVPYKGKDTASTDGTSILSAHSETSEGIPDERIQDRRVTQRLDSKHTYTLSATYDDKPPKIIPETYETQKTRLALDDKISAKFSTRVQLLSAEWGSIDSVQEKKLGQTFSLQANYGEKQPVTPETKERQFDFEKAISDNVGEGVQLLKADWVVVNNENKAALPTQPIQTSHQKIREAANKQVQEATAELKLQQNRLAAMTLTSGLTEETPVGATPYPKSEDSRSRELMRHQALQESKDSTTDLENFRKELQSLRNDYAIENFRATQDSPSLRRAEDNLTHETATQDHTGLEARDSRHTSQASSTAGSQAGSRAASPSGFDGQTGDSELSLEDDLPRKTATQDRTELEAGDSRHTSQASSVAGSQADSRAASPSGFDGQTGDSELPVQDDLTRETTTQDRTELEAGDSRAASPEWETASEGEESNKKDIVKDSQQRLPPRPDSQAGSRAASPSGFDGQAGDSELPVEGDLPREMATQDRSGQYVSETTRQITPREGAPEAEDNSRYPKYKYYLESTTKR